MTAYKNDNAAFSDGDGVSGFVDGSPTPKEIKISFSK